MPRSIRRSDQHVNIVCDDPLVSMTVIRPGSGKHLGEFVIVIQGDEVGGNIAWTRGIPHRQFALICRNVCRRWRLKPWWAWRRGGSPTSGLLVRSFSTHTVPSLPRFPNRQERLLRSVVRRVGPAHCIESLGTYSQSLFNVDRRMEA